MAYFISLIYTVADVYKLLLLFECKEHFPKCQTIPLKTLDHIVTDIWALPSSPRPPKTHIHTNPHLSVCSCVISSCYFTDFIRMMILSATPLCSSPDENTPTWKETPNKANQCLVLSLSRSLCLPLSFSLRQEPID